MLAGVPGGTLASAQEGVCAAAACWQAVRTAWNEDVLAARDSTARMTPLVQIDIGKEELKTMLVARELLDCPEDMSRRVIRSMRENITTVHEWIVSLTQALLFQGRTTRAHGVYVEGCAVRNMCASVTGDTDEVIATVIASGEMDGEIKALGAEVQYYVREQVLARLLHQRGKTLMGSKGIMLYAAVFDELERQIAFCQREGMVAREFFARYVLWREGRRYEEAYAGREGLHYFDVNAHLIAPLL